MSARLSLVGPKDAIDLGRLALMRPHDLQRTYHQIFGVPVSGGNSELARRKIAWHIQAEREGGLPESVRQHALGIAREASIRMQTGVISATSVAHTTVTGIISDHDSRLPMPGSVLVKEHKGKTLVVRVLDHGFEYEGSKFASLSAVAAQITGTKWNGFLFFGLLREGRHAR